MKNAVEYLEPNMFHTPSALLYTKMPKTSHILQLLKSMFINNP